MLAWLIATTALLAGGASAQNWRAPDDFGRGRLFSLPRTQDDIYEWRQAGEDIAAGRSAPAAERLHELMTHGRAGVVPADEIGDRFLGLHSAVLQSLRNLPEAGQEAYEKLTQREAATLLQRPFAALRRDELMRLAARFPASTAGRRARLRLGDLALEGGRGIEAAQHYRAALDAAPVKAPERKALLQRMRAAQILAGDVWSSPSRAELRGAETAARAALAAGSTTSGSWSAYGGGGSGARPMATPLGRIRPQWNADVRADGFGRRGFAMHAVGGLDGVIVNDGHSLRCFDPIAKQERWALRGPMVDDPDVDPSDYYQALNLDNCLTAAATDDIVVGALQVPNDGTNTWFRHIEVIHHIPRRRLFACDRSTGKLLWSHWDTMDGPISRRFASHDAAGPPVIWGDSVYVASHDQTGSIAYYVTAYDLRTGEPRWQQLVCSSQGEVNMFGNSRREYAASALAVTGGVVYGTTNLGVCFAADADSGRIRWVSAYDVIQMPETRLTDQKDRTVYFANNPIVVHDGVMVCTPLDSANALGIDCESGRVLWQLAYDLPGPRRNRVRWLLGLLGDEVIFSGLGIVAVKMRAETGPGRKADYREVRSPARLRVGMATREVPRGAVADGAIWHVAEGGLVALRPDGTELAAPTRLAPGTIGNLLLTEGIAVSVRNTSLDFFFDAERLIDEASDRVRDSDGDPAAILHLATLLRASKENTSLGLRRNRAEKLYREGLEAARRRGMGPASPVYRRLAAELFELSYERARREHERAPAPALALLQSARDEALQPAEWLRAQHLVLAWTRDDDATYLAELERMKVKHGSQMTSFPGVGRVPVAAFVLWESARLVEDPADAIARCQELIDRFPTVNLGDRTARDLARARQRELIDEHGADTYAAVEQDAAAALAQAGTDPSRLRELAQRYPHSRAATTARGVVLDLAVRSSDLAAAVRGLGQAAAEDGLCGSVLRRVLEVANAAGNPALAREVAERMAARFGAEASDFPADGGQPLSAVAAATMTALDRAAAAPPGEARQRPVVQIAEKLSDSPGVGPRLYPTRVPEGFVPPANPPVLVSVDGDRLEAFDATLGARLFEAPLYTVSHAYQQNQDLLMCGETMVLTEIDRVRGLNLRTGEEVWRLDAARERLLVSLGCQSGILHLFSELRKPEDAGILIGVEPTTGTEVFRRAFPSHMPCIPPVSSGGALWIFAVHREEPPHVLRLDPLTGAEDLRVPLRPALLNDLGLEPLHGWLVQPMHQLMFAKGDTLYLPVHGDQRSPPRVAAIDFDGRLRWPVWHGVNGRSLLVCAPREDHLVVVENDAGGGRLLLLDRRTGSIRRERVFEDGISVGNWSREEHSFDAPDALVMMERSRGLALGVTCFSFTEDMPSFRYGLPNGYDGIVRHPLITSDYFVLAARRAQGFVDVFCLGPRDRRSILPGSEKAHRLAFTRSLRLLPAGPYVGIQSAEGITLFGEGDTTARTK
ncbi:MAG: PQQ-binding-like beta-propeller repeat protein [Planctomycetota bacterium]